MKVPEYRMVILNRAIKRVFGNVIEVADDYSNGKYGVNWSALGTVDPVKAVEFSSDIITAAYIANALNHMNITVEYNGEMELEPKAAEDIVSDLAASIKLRSTLDFEKYLETGKLRKEA